MSSINHPEFNVNQFDKWVKSWKEGSRLDFKSEVLKVDNEKAQFKFIRHVIAFANVARRIGKPCWIIFGIGKDKDTSARVIFDVRKQFPGEKKPKGWDHPNASIAELQADGVESVYCDLAENWIEPRPDFNLIYGEYEGKFVSFLQINPKVAEKPFSLKRNYIPKEGQSHHKGEVFIRYGSSSVNVPPEEVESLQSFTKIPYLERKDWKGIVEQAQKGSDKFHELLRATPLYDNSGKKVFELILEALRDGVSFIALVGSAGQGKTTVINALAWELAHQVNFEGLRKSFAETSNDNKDQASLDFDDDSDDNKILESIIELEVVPAARVPIRIELRKAFEDLEKFENEILKAMLGYIPQNHTLQHYWSIPGSRWVILLDGLDEIINVDKFASHLKTWIEQLPSNVQVVLSSRPYALGDHSGMEVEIATLTENQIIEMIRNKIFGLGKEVPDNEIKDIVDFLANEPEMFDILRRPRAIDGFIEAWLGKSNAALTESDQISISINQLSPQTMSTNLQGSGHIMTISSVKEEELMTTEEVGLVLAPEELIPDTPHMVDDEKSDILLADILSKVTQYIYEQEKKRHRSRWGKQNLDAIEEAQDSLKQIAWLKDWSTITFDKSEMSKGKRNLNEYVGFISRTNKQREYRYLSMLFQSFCAAWYAFDFFEEMKVIKQLTNRKDVPEAARVVKLFNQLREANGREPLLIS